MTKYSISIFKSHRWNDGIALFADTANFNAIVDFCMSQYSSDNFSTTPADNIAITDLETGEVLWDYCEDSNLEPDNIDDECGFDPYTGSYSYDC